MSFFRSVIRQMAALLGHWQSNNIRLLLIIDAADGNETGNAAVAVCKMWKNLQLFYYRTNKPIHSE